MSMSERPEPPAEARKWAAEHPDSNVADAVRIYELQQEVLRLRRWITWTPWAVLLAATVTAFPPYLVYRVQAREKCVERAERVVRYQKKSHPNENPWGLSWSQLSGCRLTMQPVGDKAYTFDPFSNVVPE